MQNENIWLLNLSYSDELMGREKERREMYVRSLARPFADTLILSVREGLALIDAVTAEDCPLPDDSPFLTFDRTVFAKEVADGLATAGLVDPLGFAFLDMAEPSEHAERISLVRNRYSDLAFDLFAKRFSSPRVVASHSFRDACEEVSGGYSDYCILPIFDESDGRLRIPFSLMQQYELRICDIAEVENADGGMTQYALLSRGIVESRHNDAAFLLRIESDTPQRLSEVIGAISSFGLQCSDLWSEKGAYGFASLLTVLPCHGDMSALFLYLLLFYGGFQALGYFEQKREMNQ